MPILRMNTVRFLILRDIFFTLRDMTAVVRSTGMKGYSELMQQLGVDPYALLQRHGLPRDLGDNDDDMVPLRPIMALMEDSARITRRPDLGLQLAAFQDVQVLGPLAAAIQNSTSVREALATTSRFMFIHSPVMVFSVLEPAKSSARGIELRMEITLAHVAGQRQTMEQCVGVLHRMVKFFAAGQYELLSISLPHSPMADEQVYRRFFNAPVAFDQPHASLWIAPHTLESDLAGVNASLRNIALDYLQQHYGDQTQSTTEQVQRALRATLSTTGGSKDAVAALLFLHPRSLQRKLSAEKQTFDAIRDQVRRNAAEHYLLETHIPLAQIADLLGLADQSVLTRLCQRWFGNPPARLRKARRG